MKWVVTLMCFVSIEAFAQVEVTAGKSIQRLVQFLSIPNDANYDDQIAMNIHWLKENFTQEGFDVQELQTDGQPLFYAKKYVNKRLPTVLFYMHFDGQPVDSSKWDQNSPYNPIVKRKYGDDWKEVENREYLPEDRIFARSASDDKGPIVMFLEALRQMNESGQSQAFNIKVILDSQEEQGSPYLLPVVEKYKKDLQSDYFIAFDGPMHDTLNPTLLYGVRGIIRITMEIYGPHRAQHSGHFGNYAPNPVFLTANLLASMKNKEGKVTIDGYYDGVELSDITRSQLEEVPDDEDKINKRAGFSVAEKVGTNYQESIQYPSLNISGIRSGWVQEQTRTIVPSSCVVEMDIRTVPETMGSELIKKVKNHIERQGFTLFDHQPELAEKMNCNWPVYFEARELMYPFRTPINSPVGNWLRNSINDPDLVQLRISGGSVPLSFFINGLNVPAVLVPLVNPDNNQHSPNENLRLGNYFKGIDLVKRILTTPIDK